MDINETIKKYLNETPKGWTKDSIKKFSKTIGAGDATAKGFFGKCVSRMKKHEMGDP